MGKQGYVNKATECSQIPFNNVPDHTETKQSLCSENQQAGFYTTHVFIKSNFQTNNLNQTKLLNH